MARGETAHTSGNKINMERKRNKRIGNKREKIHKCQRETKYKLVDNKRK